MSEKPKVLFRRGENEGGFISSVQIGDSPLLSAAWTEDELKTLGEGDLNLGADLVTRHYQSHPPSLGDKRPTVKEILTAKSKHS